MGRKDTEMALTFRKTRAFPPLNPCAQLPFPKCPIPGGLGGGGGYIQSIETSAAHWTCTPRCAYRFMFTTTAYSHKTREVLQTFLNLSIISWLIIWKSLCLPGEHLWVVRQIKFHNVQVVLYFCAWNFPEKIWRTNIPKKIDWHVRRIFYILSY